MNLFELQVLVLTILIGFLITMHHRRTLQHLRTRAASEESQWTGEPLNAHGILKKIWSVRTNYCEALHPRPRANVKLLVLVADACGKVALKAYIQKENLAKAELANLAPDSLESKPS
jgi:hypothetical protein